MQITHASPDDARVVAQIHVDSWREAYKSILPAQYLASLSVEKRQTWWEKCIDDGKPELLVARSTGSVHGWINFGASRDEDASLTDGEIWAIYVSPSSWSLGIGRQLWSNASARLRSQGFRSCSLWVFPQNARAIGFYEAAGFALDTISPKSFQLAGLQLQEVRYVRRLDT
jgi:ribosomal protein S18 acetylase RimI-like enzyme